MCVCVLIFIGCEVSLPDYFARLRSKVTLKVTGWGGDRLTNIETKHTHTSIITHWIVKTKVFFLQNF